MARFRQTVVLEPVPRAWFDQAVGLCFYSLTEYFTDTGGPPTADTEYKLPDSTTKVYLESWRRDGETAVRGWDVDLDGASVWSARLDSFGNPRTADLSGEFRARGFGVGWMSAMSGTAHVDLPTWWDGTARKGIGPAITGQATQTFGRGRGTIAVAPALGGRWQVTVRVTVRGRGLLLPIAAVALLFTRSRINREFRKVMTEFAQLWNERVPTLRTKTTDELRELITDEMIRTAP